MKCGPCNTSDVHLFVGFTMLSCSYPKTTAP